MKRLFFILALTSLFCEPICAGETDKDPVVLTIRNNGQHSSNGEISRAPIRIPSLYIEDHTLSFSSSCVGYTLQLVQDDEVVYTYYIQDSDDLDLPSNLIGEYEIRLVGETFTFVGEIEL